MLKVRFAGVVRNYRYLYSWDIGNSLFRKGLIVGIRIIVYYLSFLLILLTFQGFVLEELELGLRLLSYIYYLCVYRFLIFCEGRKFLSDEFDDREGK